MPIRNLLAPAGTLDEPHNRGVFEAVDNLNFGLSASGPDKRLLAINATLLGWLSENQ